MISIRRSKGLEILLELLKGPKHVRELHSEIGGSFSTIEARIDELVREGLVCYEELDSWPFRRVLKLTERGEELAKLLKLEGGLFGAAEEKVRELGFSEHRAKWILGLLFALGGKVEGGTRLQKLLFLLKHEFGVRELPYEFVPYIYGPFSEEVRNDTAELKWRGLIEIEWKVLDAADGFLERIYKLTTNGQKMAEDFHAALPQTTKQLLQRLGRFNEMRLVELLRYVYSKYPKESIG